MGASLTLTVPEELVEAIAQRIAELVQERAANAVSTAASPWLDLAGACEYLGFSRDKLYKLSAARALPVRKKQDGQGLLFNRDELDEWLRDEYPRLDRSR